MPASRPPMTREARIARSVQSMIPGSMKGRVAEAAPVRRRTSVLDATTEYDQQDELVLPQWEDNDVHPVRTVDVHDGWFKHKLLHKSLVGEYEFMAFCNGVALDRSEYTLDSDTGYVTVTMEGWEGLLDTYRFVYAYYEDQDPPEPFSFSVFTYNGDPGTYTLTNLQYGDLVMVAYRSATNLTDPRFEMVHNFGSIGGILGPYYAKVWAAEIGADVSNLPIITSSDYFTLLRFRSGNGVPVRLDRSRKTQTATTYSGGSGSIPALPGSGSGGVSFVLTGGGIGGGYGTTSYPAPWSMPGVAGNSYGLVYGAYATDETLGSIAAPQTDSTDSWMGVAFGLSY